MGTDKMNRLFRVLLNAGLVLTEPGSRKKLRHEFNDRLDDITELASDKYDDVVDRLGRATRAVRGESNGTVTNIVGFLAGVGVGVGLGLLFAPASGEETRSAIADKVQNFEDGVRDRVSTQVRRATGTEGRD